MWSTVTAMRARTLGWRNVAGETIVPRRIRSVTRREPGKRGPRIVCVRVSADDRRVVVGAEEAFEPVLLGQACEAHPVVPRDAFLAFDHQTETHQTATSSGSVTGARQAKRSQT